MCYWFPLNASKSKYQVVHEQKFKGLLSSTCQVSVERRVLDLESEAMRGLGSMPTGGKILLCENPTVKGSNYLVTGWEQFIRTWLIRSST